MEVKECIKERRSIRRFKDEPVPKDVIESIVDLARWAPSWKNTQCARYMVIQDNEMIKEIGQHATQGFTYNEKLLEHAPTIVLLNAVNGRSGIEKDGTPTTSKGDSWQMFDAGVAAQTFCLAAHEQGIGTVIMGVFDEAEVGKLVDIPEGERFVCVIAMGYPDESPEPPKRKEPADLVTYR